MAAIAHHFYNSDRVTVAFSDREPIVPFRAVLLPSLYFSVPVALVLFLARYYTSWFAWWQLWACLVVWVVTVSRDPCPREPFEGVLQATSVLELETLELRGKRWVDSDVESFVELSWSVWDARWFKLVFRRCAANREDGAAVAGVVLSCVLIVLWYFILEAVVRVVEAEQMGDDRLEGDVRGKLLGFCRESRFYRSLIALLRVLHAGELGGLIDPDIGSCFFGLSLAYSGVVLVGPHSCLTCSRGAEVGPFVRDCEAERLFLCCVVRSRFDSFEVCSGVGTVVIAIVACRVPEWWHSFSYRWYLYPVWVMVCGSMSYTSLSGVDVELCFVEVVCTLDINSGLASRWVTSTLCWRPWVAVDMVLASIGVDVYRWVLHAGELGGLINPDIGFCFFGLSLAYSGVVLVGLHSCLTCSRGAAVGPFVRDCEAERLFLYCVVRSRFDSFEVCPSVGTVVTAIMACGVPEWWHSFSYRWYLYPVWVMVCGGMSYTSLSGVDVELCFVEVV
ncbi:hypothetical protein Taro_020252, partial [Colocasia esculenta]|nr:hypothetical protein [Colocasia esculenta]